MTSLRQWSSELTGGWSRFWFTPQDPHTLGMIRLLAGLLLFYTHLVWALDLRAFLGPQSWIPAETARVSAQWYWTPLWSIQSMGVLWIFHLTCLTVIGMSAMGLYSRVTTKLTWLVALAYVHRLHGSLFGLDQINVMLAMYLALGPSGDACSIDRWRAARRDEPVPAASVSTNIAIRLIQLHLCIIYLFGGLGKTQGALWWDGTAVWYAVSSYEYQSLDLTWLANWPTLVAALSHVTVFWETFYCALVWPRLTRPLVLMMAVCVHGGIALFLGMITFGWGMIIANMAFLSPHMTRTLTSRVGQTLRLRRVET